MRTNQVQWTQNQVRGYQKHSELYQFCEFGACQLYAYYAGEDAETEVPIHRHPQSTETVFLLSGKMVEILYEDPLLSPLEGDDVCSRLVEKERIQLDPSAGCFGCVVPAGVWHTVEVLEPSVIFESKDGRYGEDGSESR